MDCSSVSYSIHCMMLQNGQQIFEALTIGLWTHEWHCLLGILLWQDCTLYLLVNDFLKLYGTEQTCCVSIDLQFLTAVIEVLYFYVWVFANADHQAFGFSLLHEFNVWCLSNLARTIRFLVLFWQSSLVFDIVREFYFFSKHTKCKLRGLTVGSWSDLVGHQPQKVTVPHSMGYMRLQQFKYPSVFSFLLHFIVKFFTISKIHEN